MPQKFKNRKFITLFSIILFLIIGGFCFYNYHTKAINVYAAADCVSGGGLTCTQTTSGAYTINTYTYSTTPGSTTWTVPAGVTSVEYLVVGGGGSGGGQSQSGGGGAGAFITGTGKAVSGTITVVVGGGGAAVSGGGSGNNGGSSSFSDITATGGGGGGAYAVGRNGGSGGGGSNGTAGGTATNASYGHNGGGSSSHGGGGGGGAGTVGGTGTEGGDNNGYGGNGGNGLASTITGSSVMYAAGGGGSGFPWNGVGAAGAGGSSGLGGRGNLYGGQTATGGTANTGSGGGGLWNSSGGSSGAGGSGIVIIKYLTVNGTCGSSNGGNFTSAPTTNLCSIGTASAVSGDGSDINPWSWTCTGSTTGSTAYCSANLMINGACGSSNGANLSSIPTGNLCNSGTASAVSGSGPWTWNCAGTNGGQTYYCRANISLGVASSRSGLYTIEKYIGVGSTTWTVPTGVTQVEVLNVAGGGGGGMDMGGGGGGGGVIYNASYAVTPGASTTVTVGAGGIGAPAAGTNGQPVGHQYSIPATNGGNSVFGSLTAIGGGFGGSSYRAYAPGIAGGNGGSGGGASGYNDNAGTFSGGAGTSGQGYRGGNSTAAYYSGGGGGAGGAGADSTAQANGGIGYSCSILGTAYYFGGGGGGAGYSICGGNGGNGGGGGGAVCTTTGGSGLNSGAAGGGGSVNAQTNMPGGDGGAYTGGGGGGGSHYNSNNKGGNGGSGIVIIKYLTQYLTGWGYRQPITVSNSSGAVLTNYQVKLTVNYVASKMKADFSDLRFTRLDGVTLLPYYIESYTASTSAVVWVKVDSLPIGGSQIFMYYGNSSAATTSSADNTFDFFDNFTGTTINTTKWVKSDSGGYITQNGVLTISDGPPSWGSVEMHTNANFNRADGLIVQGKYKSTMVRGASYKDTTMLWTKDSGTGASYVDYIYAFYVYEYAGANYFYMYEDGTGRGVTAGTFTANTQYNIRQIIKRDGGALTQISTDGGNTWTNAYDSSYSTETPFKVGFTHYQGGDIIIDDIIVRKYASTEPTSSFGTEEGNAACGSSNGQSFVVAPTTNLCASGTASAVSGSGPWAWTCTGTVGSPASCSANSSAYVSTVSTSTNLSCFVTNGACSGTTIFNLYDYLGNHAELPAQTNYAYKVCCTGTNISNSCSGNYSIVLKLSGATNAHAEKNTLSNYTNNVCLSSSTLAVSCTYGTSCSSDFSCLASISGDTDAHVGQCSAYATKVCCRVGTPVDACTARIASNKFISAKDTDIQLCSGADITNTSDPCYNVCWKGTGTPVVTSSSWKCGICHDASNNPVSCSTLGSTTFTWTMPTGYVSPTNYTLVSGTLTSANPVVRFTAQDSARQLTLNINTYGVSCSSQSSKQANPTWKEISPFK